MIDVSSSMVTRIRRHIARLVERKPLHCRNCAVRLCVLEVLSVYLKA